MEQEEEEENMVIPAGFGTEHRPPEGFLLF